MSGRRAAKFFIGILIAAIAFAAMPVLAGGALGNVGSFTKWAKVEIDLTGPSSTSAGSPNPFAVLVDVTFTAPSGKTWDVPGFYDGNGSGGRDGNVWRVRFSADETGTWTFRSNSADGQLDGYTGSFTVTAPSGSAPEFYRWGRLEYVGTAANEIRYLKFRDGSYWLKAGCDDPENFLGSFSNYDTHQERINAVNYLADRGVNSMYMLTHNIDGDNADVWPWLGDTVSQAKSNGGSNARFDIPKLDEWLDLFEHMQDRGVAVYLILEDDSAWTGFDHDRYYRELVARFGHLPALLFNFGEEHNEAYSLSQALNYMGRLRDIDPYDHPRGIHNVNTPSSTYIDASQVDFTSIQTQHTNALNHNGDTISWINACTNRNKRVLMVNFDEPRPLLDRKGWWSAYMGGGVWEVHVDKPYNRPMSTWASAWTQIGGARAFMETLPFWEMNPSNSLVTSGQGYCLAKPGDTYAVYLPSGGTVTVNLTAGNTYRYDWWDPDNGQNGSFQNAGTVGGGSQSFTAPGSGDWALRIVKQTGGGGNSAPIANSSTATVDAGASVPITLDYTDPDGPGPYDFTITQNPSKGSLTGSGQTRTYTANAGASGTDTFRWKVNDGLADSNVATVTITITQGNQAPVAQNQNTTTEKDTPVTISLAYSDADGPGPYTFSIVQQGSHGTAVPDSQGSNDYVYTPEPGFTGTDSFRWRVNDGLTNSNVATVTIEVIEAAAPPPAPSGLKLQ